MKEDNELHVRTKCRSELIIFSGKLYWISLAGIDDKLDEHAIALGTSVS